MKVLVVGSGGREHTLAWTLARSPRVDEVLCAPGNAGTARSYRNCAVPATDLDGIVALAAAEAVDLVVVGPEDPLAAGLVDRLDAAGIRAFGPSAAAARLEGSKSWSKAFMVRHGIPTAAHASFTDVDAALAHLATLREVPVVKASGLAAGKGVVMPASFDEAAAAVRDMLVGDRFGAAGTEVVIEEWMRGEERSVFAICSGTDAVVLAPARDHKRLRDGDLGPNTGGMGAYAPAPLDDAVLDEVLGRIVRPTLAGMAAEGCPYSGVLYVGLMIGAGGPKVVEFNCRFGDPEAQVVLPLLDTDLVDVIDAALDDRLGDCKLAWRDGAATTVVLASPGYPERSTSGLVIDGIDAAEATGALVLHAGTALDGEGRTVTAGGRVLAVTGFGADLALATDAAYAGVAEISFEDAQYRRDIARQEATP
ncbi:MAG: phosphoribosylamine--glycine ligase [Acidimicrobiia bacterium]|nr:phosphoribosylamine--glycine ligase [Acidimicrobiia bacterium]